MLRRTGVGQLAPGELDGGAEPGRALGIVVLDEGGEFCPTTLALEEECLADLDAPELCGQGKSHHPR